MYLLKRWCDSNIFCPHEPKPSLPERCLAALHSLENLSSFACNSETILHKHTKHKMSCVLFGAKSSIGPNAVQNLGHKNNNPNERQVEKGSCKVTSHPIPGFSWQSLRKNSFQSLYGKNSFCKCAYNSLLLWVLEHMTCSVFSLQHGLPKPTQLSQ